MEYGITIDEFAKLQYEKQIDWAVGFFIANIGKESLRDIIGRIIHFIAHESYHRGINAGRKEINQ